MKFAFTFTLTFDQEPDTVEIEARNLTEAVTFFLRGQWPDTERGGFNTCDDVESFTVKRL